jgi:hypothetical protein
MEFNLRPQWRLWNLISQLKEKDLKIKERKNQLKINEEEILKVKNAWNLKFKEDQSEVEKN